MYPVMKKIVDFIMCRFLYHVKYEQLERLQAFENGLICPNHTNIFDPLFIFPKTDHLWIMAKSELFANPILAKIWKHYQVFPIQRGKSDIGNVKYIMKQFQEQDKIRLLMFPEGGILSKEKRRKKIRKGAVHMAASMKLPILPVSITEHPRLFHRVVVRFHEPMFFSEEVLQNREKLQEASNTLLQTLYF